MAARGRLFRSPLLTFGDLAPRGVTCEWTHELRPVGGNPVATGETIELHVAVDTRTHALSGASRVRFDVVTEGAPEPRVASLVGTGADPPPAGAGTTEARTTVFRSLALAQTLDELRGAFVGEHPSDFASHLLVVAEAEEPPARSHLLTWLVTQAPADRPRPLHFRVDVDGELQAQTDEPLQLSAESPDDRTIKLLLKYEDESPMPSAEFEAVFVGNQRRRGRTGADGRAEIAMPVGSGDVFRLFLVSFPEHVAGRATPQTPPVPTPPPGPAAPPADVPPLAMVPAETLPPVGRRPETVAAFAFNSAFPSPIVHGSLLRVREKQGFNRGVKLVVFGHTDKVGGDAYNVALSERRAHAVLALLLDDREMFEAVATAEGWDTRVHQSMLRGVGCNPGAIDGQVGPITRKAVQNFQREYNLGVYHEHAVVPRDRPTLSEDGVLGPATYAAIRDAYVAVAPHVRPESFADPQFSGCGKAHPISDVDADNRRAVVAFFADDVDLTQSSPRDSYEALVGETPEDRRSAHFFDHQWLREETGALQVSAATVVADGTPATIRVVRCEGQVPFPLPDSSGGGQPPELGPVLAELPAEVHGGICSGRWATPDPVVFDANAWPVDHDVQLDIVDAADNAAPASDDPASSAAILAADPVHPPVAIFRAGEKWGVSGPPAARLNRIRFGPDADGPRVNQGLALRTHGSLLPFVADGGLVGFDEAAEVVSLALPDQEVGVPEGTSA